MSIERTFIMIKPDGVQRCLIGQIIQRFEQRGYKLVAMKFTQPTKEILEEHYSELKLKSFFTTLIVYILSGPVLAMVWEGKDIIKQGRSMLGETDPLSSLPGSIRGHFSVDISRNICHCSDTIANANKEIAIWFNELEVTQWKPSSHESIYE